MFNNMHLWLRDFKPKGIKINRDGNNESLLIRKHYEDINSKAYEIILSFKLQF